MSNSDLKGIESYILDEREKRGSHDVWFNDVSLLFNPAFIFEIIPTLSMNMNEKINALTRFAFFLSLLLTIIKQNYVYIYVFLIPVIISYIAYVFIPQKEKFTNLVNESENTSSDEPSNFKELSNEDKAYNMVMESALNEDYQRPTKDNPLMNILPTDNFEKRKPACNITDVDVAKEVSDLITDKQCEKMYRDTNYIFNGNIGERDFYTMPASRIPNDQGSFAKWLYQTPVSCAIGNDGILKQFRSCAFNNKTLDEMKRVVN